MDLLKPATYREMTFFGHLVHPAPQGLQLLTASFDRLDKMVIAIAGFLFGVRQCRATIGV